MKATSLVISLAVIGLAVVIHDVLLVVFGGILVALLLRGLALLVVSKTRMPAGVALALSILTIVVLSAAAAWYGGALFVGQITALRADLPYAFQQALESIRHSVWGVLVPNVPAANDIMNGALSMMQRATSLISTTVGAFVAVIVMLFVGVCLAAEPSLYLNGAVLLAPTQHRERIRALLIEIGATLRAWLFARLVSMLAIAVFVSIGLQLLHIPFPLILGGLAGLLAFMPNIGALVAALPAIAFALAIGLERAGLVITMYWLAHFIDDFLIIPIAERRIVNLPPALTITVQLMLGTFVGVLGIMFAAPLTAATLILARRLWIENADT